MAVVISGDNAIFEALVYGHGNRSGYDYMAQLNDQFRYNVQPQVLQGFDVRVADLYSGINADMAMNQLRAASREFMQVFQPDGIFELQLLNEFQHANFIMQHYLMANPIIQQMSIDGKIAGYSETYEMPEPKLLGNDNYTYRRVTNGIWVADENGDYSMTNWCEYVNPEDELSYEDQHYVMKSWDSALGHIFSKQQPADPTDHWNGSM